MLLIKEIRSLQPHKLTAQDDVLEQLAADAAGADHEDPGVGDGRLQLLHEHALHLSHPRQGQRSETRAVAAKIRIGAKSRLGAPARPAEAASAQCRAHRRRLCVMTSYRDAWRTLASRPWTILQSRGEQ